MSPLTDIEINRKLALAIGWKNHEIALSFSGGIWLCTHVATLKVPATHRRFDYKDPLVIWPIAEKFDCFPYRMTHQNVMPKLRGMWNATGVIGNNDNYADSAAKAVALAVIWMQP